MTVPQANECGPETGADTFIEWWWKADRGELEPFVLVVEGSIPNEAIEPEGYWSGFGNNPATGQPMTPESTVDTKPAGPAERCEMCGTGLAERHGHVVDTDRRVLVCACRPVRVWRDTVDRYFPNSGWIRLSNDTLDALGRFKSRQALSTWDSTVGALLAAQDRAAAGLEQA